MRHRYDLLLGAALAALATPALAADAAPPAGTAPHEAADAAFSAPTGPLVLTRELRKTVAGNHEFVSRRRYAVRFAPEGAGWRVEGTLVSSEVEAPARMDPRLVELERARGDEGLFPLKLDRSGMIVAQSGGEDPRNDARTLAAATAVLGKAGLSPEDRAAALRLAAGLQAQARAAGGNWPVDLFRPRTGERSEVRRFPLGDHGEGRVTITVAAAGDARGVMERLQRRIVTETAGTSRLSVETWTMTRAR